MWKPAVISSGLIAGRRSMIPALTASTCACACSIVAPAFSRATSLQLLLWRAVSALSLALNVSGIHSITSGLRKAKFCGRTPTTV